MAWRGLTRGELRQVGRLAAAVTSAGGSAGLLVDRSDVVGVLTALRRITVPAVTSAPVAGPTVMFNSGLVVIGDVNERAVDRLWKCGR